ncbi:hypothetical protein DSO57_1000297 [Entomophthora muscae]|uniref:Uncharacterized protein n=1 Tax=Entomophthora muscae TaxID=34485 RepID=A0ACC2SYA7_9FUNG|nr:hypothetical protein DSO57_1000297 [Entomophthora muscae]
MKDAADREIEGLKLCEEKSVEIMTRWSEDNKALNQKIASLETKLAKALLQEGSSNKSLNKNNYDINSIQDTEEGCQTTFTHLEYPMVLFTLHNTL